MVDCNYCNYVQKVEILCGELGQFFNHYFVVFNLGLSNVHGNEFETKETKICSCYCRVEKLLL